MKKLFLFILIFCSIFQACTKEKEYHCAQIEENIIVAPEGNFQNLQVGDEFRYQFFNGEDNEVNSTNYTLRNDTLIVSVSGIKNGKFVISEKMSAGSGVLNGMENTGIWRPESIDTSHWKFQNDSLIIELPPGVKYYGLPSRLFWSHVDFNLLSDTSKSLSLSLKKDYNLETEICGWKTTHQDNYQSPVRKLFLFVRNGIMRQKQYRYINVMKDNIETASDGSTYHIFYTKEHGILRTSKHGSWGAQGWELIN